MAIGIRTAFQVPANVVVTASVTLVTTGLTSPIAAGQTQKLRFWVPITVGATGGVRASLLAPAGGTIFEQTTILYDTITPAITTAIVNTPTVFTNALAQAGSHWLLIEAVVVNGATAGNVDLQMACNTAANALTVLRGGSLEVIKF